MPCRVAVVVVTFDAAGHVRRCLESLARGRLEELGAEVIVVDNASKDGTAELVRDGFPWVTLVENERNRGFAGGNNVGIERALARGAEYVYLLNPDTEVHPDFLGEALAVARADPAAAAVQSLVLLMSDRDRINTAGNEIHFLGFGYCAALNAPRDSAPASAEEVAFASGAAVLLSSRVLREVGLLDEELFLYHEDLDLGWRFLLAGYHSVLAPRSVVWHCYEFSRNRAKYYFLERNRYVVLAKNLQLRSLAVLAPLLLASEAGLLGLSAVSGWLPEKLRADAHLLRPAIWRHVRRERSRIATFRRRRDREVAASFTAALELDGVRGKWIPSMLRVPMRLAWRLIRPFLA